MRSIHQTCRTTCLVLLGFPAIVSAAEPPRERAESIRAVCERLEIREGSRVADIGCGDGEDTVQFARIVGVRGTVFAEEIDLKKVESVRDRAQKEGLSQVTPVLGQPDDPRLPNGNLDLIYMRSVFHHFAKPRDMLRSFWFDLRPGGLLVIVDREKGPMRDLVPYEQREKSHHWVGETTVVRQAREAGFEFVDAPEGLWYEKEPFVLAFRRPVAGDEPHGDPDLPLPLVARAIVEGLPIVRSPPPTVATIALGRGRTILGDLREVLGPDAKIVDVVIDEWAELKDEVPAEPANVATTVLRTEKGELAIPDGLTFSAVIFADAYHLLWQPDKLLKAFAGRLAENGVVAVMDRGGPEDVPRNLASHRRRIGPASVRRELEAAGFTVSEGAAPPAADRFVLVARPRPRQTTPASGGGQNGGPL
jgi:ubiquinone/menaquinone biosynthesis C-methylase UbiE